MGFQIAPDQLLPPSVLPSGDHRLAPRNDFLIFSQLEDAVPSGSALLTEFALGLVRLRLVFPFRLPRDLLTSP